jgi:hypothetical protein
MRWIRSLLVAPCAALAVSPPAALAQTTTTHDTSSSAPLILLAAAGVVMVLGGLIWAAGRWWAYDAPWLSRARHAAAEAGWRTSAAWADFRDWLRLGR